METLDQKTLENIGHHASKLDYALLGLAALMRESQNFEYLNSDEMQGISELMMVLRDEMFKVRETLIEKDMAPAFEQFASEDDLKRTKEVRQKRQEEKAKAKE